MRSRTAAANSARHSRASGNPVPSPDVAAAAETLVPGFRRDDARSIGSRKTRLVARNHHPLDLGRTFVNLGDLGVAESAPASIAIGNGLGRGAQRRPVSLRAITIRWISDVPS